MKKPIVASMISAVLLSACGGGGSSSGGDSSSVVGLQMPSTMSVVTAQGSGAGTTALQRLTAAQVSFASGTDYNSDPSRTYVYDPSMEPLDTVNMILCLMDQTHASDMVNQGAYTALIDEDKCEQGANQSSSGQTGQSSSQVSQLNKWVIESTRSDNAAAQHVKLWVPPSGKGDGGPMDQQRILVEIEAREGVSASKPFGDFTLNFKGVVDAGILAGGSATGVDTQVMAGTLKTDPTNPTRFQFIEKDGDALSPGAGGGMFSRESATDVILDDAAGTSGRAVTAFNESFDDGVNPPNTSSASFSVAFDADYLLREKDGTTQACTDRNNFNTQTWRYNLYHQADGTFNGKAVSAGERVALNSGFPFKTASGDFGHIGYYGLWLENGSIADGDTISRFDYGSNNATTDYTVNMSPGKMISRTANSITLDKLVGEQLYYWGEDPNNPGTFGQWQVEVNPSTYAFEITGSVQEGDNGPQVTPMTAVDITPTVDGESLWLWSDSLGGNITYVYSTSNVVSASATLTFYAEEFVYPDGSALADGTTLYCYDRCLKGGVVSAASESDLFYPSNGTLYTYTVNVSGGKLTLTDDTASASVDMSSLDLSSLGYDWGIQSGEMVTDISGLTNWWEIYDAPVSLRWETGSNEWNRLTTVSRVSDGTLATFDKPLTFTYTHSTANDANGSSSHDGKVFLLEYGGTGDLHGFPWVEDSDTKRWHSPVTLKNGTVLTDGTNNFVVKAIESEQTMELANTGDAADISACTNAGLSVAGLGISVPTTLDGTVMINWSDKPTVTDPPAVIEGELQ